MLIGIDGNEANVEKRVGVGEYAFELLRQFSSSKFKVSAKDGSASGRQSSKFVIYLKGEPKGNLPKETENWQYRVIGPKKLWTQIGLPIDLYFHKPRPDVFFTPTHYAPRFSPVPTAISIMDLAYIRYPALFKKSDLYQLKNWTAYSVRNAKRIFTISQASKGDIIKEYQVPEKKIVVTYPGVKDRIMNNELRIMGRDELKKKYGIEGKYILFVGTLQPRKNIVRLIEAFSMLISTNEKQINTNISSRFEEICNNSNVDLVIVGKKGWLYEDILEAPKKFGIEDKVRFLDFVPDEDLPAFYKNALCFVLPSLYEGFGLPILEAMQYGCPVITSNVSSLPEAGGDAAFYVNPESVDDIASKMELLIKDGKLRQEMIEKGYKQVNKFSWEKTARETLSVLEEVVAT